MREVLLYFMTDIIKIIIAVVASAVVFGIVGFLLGQMHRKRVAEAEIGSATQEATRIVNNALAEAETKKRKPSLRQRTKFTNSATSWNASCGNAAQKFSARNAGSSKRRRRSTARLKISKKRMKRSTKN